VRVLPSENRVVVQGVNMIKRIRAEPHRAGRHRRARRPRSIFQRGAARPPSRATPAKIGFKTLDDGSKVRSRAPLAKSSTAKEHSDCTRLQEHYKSTIVRLPEGVQLRERPGSAETGPRSSSTWASARPSTTARSRSAVPDLTLISGQKPWSPSREVDRGVQSCAKAWRFGCRSRLRRDRHRTNSWTAWSRSAAARGDFRA